MPFLAANDEKQYRNYGLKCQEKRIETFAGSHGAKKDTQDTGFFRRGKPAAADPGWSFGFFAAGSGRGAACHKRSRQTVEKMHFILTNTGVKPRL